MEFIVGNGITIYEFYISSIDIFIYPAFAPVPGASVKVNQL
jgi:hypothetical protein